KRPVPPRGPQGALPAAEAGGRGLRRGGGGDHLEPVCARLQAGGGLGPAQRPGSRRELPGNDLSDGLGGDPGRGGGHLAVRSRRGLLQPPIATGEATMSPTRVAGADTVLDRLQGGLLGVAVGDALGATLEFAPPQPAGSLHTEISGGGVFGWAPGAPTDDTDLTIPVAEAYAAGFSLEGVADRFLAWYQAGPKDVGGTTAAALRGYGQRRDPRNSGSVGERSAANGSLMRNMPVAPARGDTSERRREAPRVGAIPHPQPRRVQACVVYCDLADALVRGIPVAMALVEARETF